MAPPLNFRDKARFLAILTRIRGTRIRIVRYNTSVNICFDTLVEEPALAFNPINWLLGLFSLDIAIDLGTANTLVHVRGKGIVINEPSWVTIDKRSRHPLAIGLEAKEMMGRTPSSVAVIRPLRDGVISEFDITQTMLEYFIGRVHEQSVVPLPRPRVVVGIPTGVTEVEKRAVYDAVMASGARAAYLIEEPIAAALGAGLPVADEIGRASCRE